MDQSEMERMLERLLAKTEAHMKAEFVTRTESTQHERKADKEEMMARMDSNQEKTEMAINSLRSALEGAIKTRVEMKHLPRSDTCLSGEEGTNSRRDRGRSGEVPGNPRGSNG
jgi:hypothetical protein